MESRAEEIMDSRLSNLPDDIIHKILSTMTMGDVIKTSVLSSRWRYVWTSMPYLNFSYTLQNCCDLGYIKELFDKGTQFVKNVLSHRNNQVPLSSVKLNIYGDVSPWDIDILIKYILSHNVQQVDVECRSGLFRNEDSWRRHILGYHHLLDDSELLVTPFSSQSLKHLSLTMEHGLSQYLTVLSTMELPALMTLYLSHVELYGDANTLFSKCPNLKNLTLKSCKMEGSTSSILQLPALTTLYLSCVELYPDENTLFSKCPNLKNLTLKSCKMKELDCLSICHQQLSNLTLEHDMGSAKVVNVDAPQLQNLTIRYRFKDFESYYQDDISIDCWHEYYHAHPHYTSTYYRDCLHEYKHLISAPNLISLRYEGYDHLPLSTDGFHSLEKVDLCICSISQEATEALEIVRLFQQIQSVTFLKLNLEILELLSSHVQVISHYPPPFANLKSLDIYPKKLNTWKTDPKEIVNISTEVINYLLDSSQGATFTMFSRQEALADMKAAKVSVRMADLQTYLDREKDIIETNRYQIQQPSESMYNDDDNEELQIRKDTKQINTCWINHEELVSRGRRIVKDITSYLEKIESLLTQLPASKRAMLQPCFSSLCAESNIFVTEMTERIKIYGSENLSNASDRFHELTTSLQSSS